MLSCFVFVFLRQIFYRSNTLTSSFLLVCFVFSLLSSLSSQKRILLNSYVDGSIVGLVCCGIDSRYIDGSLAMFYGYWSSMLSKSCIFLGFVDSSCTVLVNLQCYHFFKYTIIYLQSRTCFVWVQRNNIVFSGWIFLHYDVFDSTMFFIKIEATQKTTTKNSGSLIVACGRCNQK